MSNHPLYEHFASTYDSVSKSLLREGNQTALKHLANLESKVFLEVACGAGASFEFYPKNSKVIAIDLSESMIAKAKHRAQEIKDCSFDIQLMDATTLTFPESSFDAVFLPSVVSVVNDPDRVIAEALRVLKKNGLLLTIAHFAEFSPYPKSALHFLSATTQILGGFKLSLSIDLLQKRKDLKIESISPTNRLANRLTNRLGTFLPLSSLVVARKNAE